MEQSAHGLEVELPSRGVERARFLGEVSSAAALGLGVFAVLGIIVAMGTRPGPEPAGFDVGTCATAPIDGPCAELLGEDARALPPADLVARARAYERFEGLDPSSRLGISGSVAAGPPTVQDIQALDRLRDGHGVRDEPTRLGDVDLERLDARPPWSTHRLERRLRRVGSSDALVDAIDALKWREAGYERWIAIETELEEQVRAEHFRTLVGSGVRARDAAHRTWLEQTRWKSALTLFATLAGGAFALVGLLAGWVTWRTSRRKPLPIRVGLRGFTWGDEHVLFEDVVDVTDAHPSDPVVRVTLADGRVLTTEGFAMDTEEGRALVRALRRGAWVAAGTESRDVELRKLGRLRVEQT